MVEIKIPQTIKIGGFDYKVIIGNDIATGELLAAGHWGECDMVNRTIKISQYCPPQQFQATFLHELVHGILDTFTGLSVERQEEVTLPIGNGFLQIFEQLGITFVKE